MIGEAVDVAIWRSAAESFEFGRSLQVCFHVQVAKWEMFDTTCNAMHAILGVCCKVAKCSM